MNALRNNWHIISLVAITFLGFLLRIYQLDWQCLMVDEVVTADIASHTSAYIIHWALNIDCNPPTYYLLAHWSSIVLGGNTWFSVRIPAVILGTLAIPMSYLVGNRIKGKTLGLLTATLISFMFPFVLYAQNARGYSLVLCAFLGFIYFWLALYDGDRNLVTVAECSIFAALCMYAHYFSIVPVTLALVILLWKNQQPALKVLGIFATLLIPLAILSNPWNMLSRAAPEIIPGYMMMTPNHEFWVYPIQMATYLPNELLCWSWTVILPFAAYAFYRYREGPVRPFIIIATLPCIVLICVSYISNLMPRYAILVSPLFILAAMFPVSELIDSQPSNIRKSILFVLAIFVIALFNYGSLLSWYTFNVCPLVYGIDAAIIVVS